MLLKPDLGKLDFNPSCASEELRMLFVPSGFPHAAAHPAPSLRRSAKTIGKRVFFAGRLRVASQSDTLGIKPISNLPKTLLRCCHSARNSFETPKALGRNFSSFKC